jgi:hypothetical protein
MKRSWSAREWVPKAATLTLIGVTTTPESAVVHADGPSSARCPASRRRPHSRHSRYWRTLKIWRRKADPSRCACMSAAGAADTGAARRLCGSVARCFRATCPAHATLRGGRASGRWSPLGAQHLLHVRTAMLNGRLHGVAGDRRRRMSQRLWRPRREWQHAPTFFRSRFEVNKVVILRLLKADRQR